MTMVVRIPDADIERARGRYDVILRDVPTKRQGRELVGRCPFHNEKTGSFYVYGDGHFHCFGCGAHGTPIDYVMRVRNLDFPDAVREILQLPVSAPQMIRQKVTRPEDRADDVAEARAIWAASSAEDRRRVELYFRSRYLWPRGGIPPTIREHHGLYCHERRSELPAMVSAVKDSSGFICAVQRVWLESTFIVDPDGGDVKGTRIKEAPKKTRGEMRDGCVRLAPLGRQLGLAEGIETGFAAMELFDLSVWAACGTARFGFPAHWRELTITGVRPRLWFPPDRPLNDLPTSWVKERPPTIWVPPEVEEIIIFGDNGETGRIAAGFAADWWCRHGRPAQAIFPDDGFGDFQEQLRAEVLHSGTRRVAR
jgi:DNA primase